MSKPLCAICISEMWSAATYVDILRPPAESERIDAPAGLPVLGKALGAVDSGARLSINGNYSARLYADTMIRGTAVCMGHIYELQHDRPDPWGLFSTCHGRTAR